MPLLFNYTSIVVAEAAKGKNVAQIMERHKPHKQSNKIASSPFAPNLIKA
jgi:hypothetical protein